MGGVVGGVTGRSEPRRRPFDPNDTLLLEIGSNLQNIMAVVYPPHVEFLNDTQQLFWKKRLTTSDISQHN